VQPSQKRLTIILLCLGIVVLFLVRGNEPEVEKPEPEAEEAFVRVPLPATPRKDRLKEAHGIYILENDKARFSLELQPNARFRFLSQVTGRARRDATGTWSLVGSRLTLAYTHVNGERIEDGPQVAVNVYQVSAIELKETGLSYPVVLKKRTMIRQR